MSKHITTLKINVAPLIAALPAGTFLHSVSLRADLKAIEVIWEHDASKTGRTYPVEYPVEKLEELAPKVIAKNRKLVKPELWPFRK